MKLKATISKPLSKKKISQSSKTSFKLKNDTKKNILKGLQNIKQCETDSANQFNQSRFQSGIMYQNSKKISKSSKKDLLNVRTHPQPVHRPKQASKLGPAGIVQESILLQPRMMSEAVSSLFKIIKQKSYKKEGNTKLLNTPEPIFMQVESVKIPLCPRKQLRFLLPHSLTSSESDVLLITADKKGQRIYPEKAVEYYTELLAKKNVDFIQKIIPCKTLKIEYSQYESKRKLVDQYDVILADNSVIKFLYGWLGKYVNYKKKMPIAVRLNTPNLLEHFLNAVRKTQMSVKGNGHTSTVQVGHSRMTQKELVENIEAVCKGLSAKFPGGANNIRCLTIKTSTSTTLPLFLSLVSPNDVKTPVELSKKKGKPIEGELSTILGATAVVYPDGNVNVKRNKKDNTVYDDSEDDDILKEVQKNLEDAKTVRTVDSDEESLEDEKLNKSNDYDDMEADAVTDAMEQEVMSKYTYTPNQGNLSNSEEEDDLSSIDVEQKATKAQKQEKSKQSVKKETKGVKGSKGVMSSPHGGKVKKAKDQNKKNKINKNMRKAMIKKKNANKKK